MEKGCFIVFEGIDGAGKTTQAKMLASKLEALGKKVYITAEPTDFPTGKELRRVLGGEEKKTVGEVAAMFVLDRIAHNVNSERGIEKMLSEGAVIICDRYYYSSLAYQGSAIDYSWVKAMNVNCPEIRRPDICIFLDLTPQESMKRISAGRKSTEIYENTDTLSRVRDIFMKVIDDMKDTDKIEVISAMGKPEDISEKIFDAVKKVL